MLRTVYYRLRLFYFLVDFRENIRYNVAIFKSLAAKNAARQKERLRKRGIYD